MAFQLDMDFIRNHAANEATFNRGYAYYLQGRATQFRAERDQSGMSAEGCVRGGSTYRQKIMIRANGKIVSAQCTCPVDAYGLCKHCVALLIDVLNHADEAAAAQRTPPEKKDMPAIRTDASAQRLLDAFATRDEAQNVLTAEEPVRIIPNIETDIRYQHMILGLSVGRARPYVVRNIPDFLEAVRARRVVVYGKGLSFPHCPEAFDEDGRALIDFLNCRYGECRSAFSRWDTANGKKLFLTPAAIDEFFSLYAGKTVADARGKPLAFGEADVPIDLEAAPLPDGAFSLRCALGKALLMTDRAYVVRPDSLLRLPEERGAALSPLLSAFKNNDMLVFGAADKAAFCADVLPDIEKYVALRDPHGVLAGCRPEAFEARLYLDAPTRDRVTARAVVAYGEDLFDAASGQAFDPPDEPRREGRQAHTRDPRAERRFVAAVRQVIPADGDGQLAASGDAAVYDLLTDGFDRLRGACEIHVSDRLRRLSPSAPVRANVGVALDSGLLRVNIDLVGAPMEELTAILAAYREKRRYYRLRDGAFLRLDQGALGDVAQLAEGLQLSDKQLAAGRAELPAFRAMYLDGLFREGGRETSFKRNDAFRRLVRAVRDAADGDYPVPAPLAGVLRGYQEAGYRWLRTLEACGLCGILADDMGLGKTLEMIALLVSYYGDGRADQRPALIVCPASLVLNWQSEIRRFAPALSVKMILGPAAARAALIAGLAPNDIAVTSYDLLRRDADLYAGVKFHYCVLDEAQFIKNQNTKGAQAVKRIDSAQRFALTGTPIENRLGELWSIFDFLMPGYLYAYARFRRAFELPVVRDGDEEARARLRRMIAPFVLRRLKRDVLTELPPKTTTVLPVEMDEAQKKLYDAVLVTGLKQLRAKGDAEGEAQTRIKVFALLTRLRQICCDPALCYADYAGQSAKLEACVELLREAKEGGHKVLLFSQFTSMLAILRGRLERENLTYLLLQGDTPKEERLNLAGRFNAGQADVMLVSLKAGGTGLNLTGADVVVHYDPWWNLAAQEQATDRAHRIGQQKRVHVYKLIVSGTIEEKIAELQALKGDLAAIIEQEEGASVSTLSAEELINLLENR